MSRLPNFQQNRLSDGGEVVSLMRRRPFTLRKIPVFISVRGWVNSGEIVRLEGLGQLKNTITSPGIKTATFWLVAQCLDELRYRVPLLLVNS
jgi:hypothetical protein